MAKGRIIGEKYAVGKKFGMLTVVGAYPKNPKRECQCECGRIVWKMLRHLNHARLPNCGCKTSEIIKKTKNQHGMGRHPAYQKWLIWRNNSRWEKGSAKMTPEWARDFTAYWDFVRPYYDKGLKPWLRRGTKSITPDTLIFVPKEYGART